MATIIGKIRKTVKSESQTKGPTKAETQAKLKELGIKYDKNANKETLISLLPQE